jgi:hypothetical protein
VDHREGPIGSRRNTHAVARRDVRCGSSRRRPVYLGGYTIRGDIGSDGEAMVNSWAPVGAWYSHAFGAKAGNISGAESVPRDEGRSEMRDVVLMMTASIYGYVVGPREHTGGLPEPAELKLWKRSRIRRAGTHIMGHLTKRTDARSLGCLRSC